MSSKPTEAIDVTPWERMRGVVRSRKGGWKPGQGVFCHGYDMMADFVGRKSWMQVVILNATGRLVDRPLADWFDAIHICLSWPDPRIWCNQMGALGGTARTEVVAATVAGILAADSRSYGARPLRVGLAFIQRAMVEYREGRSVEEIVTLECARHAGRPHIMGYARPIARGDERIEAMERVSADLGFQVGPHLELAYAIERELSRRFDETMNINGFMSAFLSDQGMTPEEVYRICAVLVTSGVTACYVDARARPAEGFLPMRCDDVDYIGPAPRPVPERD